MKTRQNTHTQHERWTVLTLDNNFQLGIINYSRLNKRLEISRLAYGPIHMGYTVDSVLFKIILNGQLAHYRDPSLDIISNDSYDMKHII